MKKIRIGNDFVLSLAIERGGVPENLDVVLDKHLYINIFGTKTEIHNYTNQMLFKYINYKLHFK